MPYTADLLATFGVSGHAWHCSVVAELARLVRFSIDPDPTGAIVTVLLRQPTLIIGAAPIAQAGRVRPQMRCGEMAQLSTGLKQLGLRGRITTAFVERLNVTIRQSVAPLVRRSWSTAQQVPQLLLHLELWRAYYHYLRPHQALRLERAQGLRKIGKRRASRYRHRTPAMAAGLTSHRWTMRELLMLPLPTRSLGVT